MGAGFKISIMYAFFKSIFAKKESLLPDLDKSEVKRLERALRIWVEEKRYREYSNSRDDIASQLGTTKEFLNLYFRRILKADFNTWRTSLRVDDAKITLLEHRELPIDLVGEMVGFSDRSNFHRQFTKLTGKTPKLWRESAGK